MRRILHLLAAAGALLAASCSLLDYSNVVTRRYAIVYGVSTYVSSLASNACNSPNLTYPSADARDLTAMLEAGGYNVRSRWVDGSGNLYVDGTLVGDVSSNAESAPTRDTLQSDLASLSSSIGSNDEFVFYFSGHGMQSSDGTHEFFIPYGGIASLPCGPYTFYYGSEGTSVRDDELGSFLASDIGTSRRVCILDTCYSGGFISNALEVDTTPSTTSTTLKVGFSLATIATAVTNYASFTADSAAGVSAYDAQVLSAAGAGESCYDDSDHEHGAMTYYLLKIAEDGDLNGDGSVTVLEAFSLVKAGIEENWNVDYPSSAFTPHISGGPVDFVLF
jgi:hypothetical protein